MECDRLREVKALLRSLVQTTIEKVTIEKLNRDYNYMMGENIPHKSFGFSTLDEFLRSLKDTLIVFGSDDMAQVCVIGDSKSRHIHDFVMQQKSSRKAKRKTLQINNKIVRQLPMAFRNRGLSCVQSVNRNKFRKTWSTNKNHNLVNNSFQSKVTPTNTENELRKTDKELLTNDKELETNVKKTVKNIEKNNDDNEYLNEKDIYNDAVPEWAANNVNNLIMNLSHAASMESNEQEENILQKKSVDVITNENNINWDYEASEVTLTLDALSIDLIKNVEQFGTEIPPYNSAPDVEVGSTFRIIITEICSPSRFWFQIQKDAVDEIDVLMDQIECYYNGLKAEDLLMPPDSMALGQICCALHDGIWYRGEILNIPLNGAVKVFFVDYGTVDRVAVEHIKYLILSFTRLHAQALLGTLSYIEPIGTCWTTEATLYFKSLIIGSILWAKILNIRKQGHVYCMALCDGTKEERLINNALVRKGYALYINNN